VKKRAEFEADLHNHTTASDGSMTPWELVKTAAEMGLQAVSVTDHDTIEGLEEALSAGSACDVEVVPGLEITLRFTREFFRGSLHLLVYFSPDLLRHPPFIRAIEETVAKGRGPALTRARIQAVNRVFAPGSDRAILPEPLRESHVYAHGKRISRRHFALALKDMGITDSQTITDIIGNDSPAYIPSGIPLETLQPFLESWPLTRILAHPAAGSYPGESHYREVLPPFETVDRLIPEFMAAGLDGFEVEYPGHTAEWKQRLRSRMSTLGLRIETGGSDCHDSDARPLGVAGTSMKMVRAIQQNYQ